MLPAFSKRPTKCGTFGKGERKASKRKSMKTLYDYCMENDRQELLPQWNVEKNLPLTPRQVAYWSAEKAWWRCEKGHEWRGAIVSRCRGVGCPYCAGVKVQKGYNDLASQNPKLAAQWNYKKNGSLTPDGASPTVDTKYEFVHSVGSRERSQPNSCRSTREVRPLICLTAL